MREGCLSTGLTELKICGLACWGYRHRIKIDFDKFRDQSMGWSKLMHMILSIPASHLMSCGLTIISGFFIRPSDHKCHSGLSQSGTTRDPPDAQKRT